MDTDAHREKDYMRMKAETGDASIHQRRARALEYHQKVSGSGGQTFSHSPQEGAEPASA